MREQLNSIYGYQVLEKNYLTPKHVQLKIIPLTHMMPYLAGQYLTLRYPNGEFMPFSIANSASQDQIIELHIKVVPSDEQTVLFIKQTEIGRVIEISGPLGSPYLDEPAGTLLLLAAGTGFAAAKAIIEQLTETNLTKRCGLYWTVREESDFYLPKLPAFWQTQLPQFFYQPICTQQSKIKILEKVMTDFNSFNECQVYVFGPRPLAITTLQTLTSKGLKKENFYSDMLSPEEIILL